MRTFCIYNYYERVSDCTKPSLGQKQLRLVDQISLRENNYWSGLMDLETALIPPTHLQQTRTEAPATLAINQKIQWRRVLLTAGL